MHAAHVAGASPHPGACAQLLCASAGAATPPEPPTPEPAASEDMDSEDETIGRPGVPGPMDSALEGLEGVELFLSQDASQ